MSGSQIVLNQLLQGENRVFIPGPEGNIEASFCIPDSPNAAVIVCHPHPLYGGTMHNKVVTSIVKAAISCNFATCRFNYRGVGKSQGSYDDAQGEQEDAICVQKWFTSKLGFKKVWLIGFSFGAYIAYKVADKFDLNGLVLVAPAVNNMSYIKDECADTTVWIIHGSEDEITPLGDVVKLQKELALEDRLIVVEGASHFFHGCLIEVMKNITTIISGVK